MKGDPGVPLPIEGARGGASALSIARLARDDRDVGQVDVIARAAFDDGAFSAEKELERPWARVWVARALGAIEGSVVVGFLETWHVADELHVLNIATEPRARRRGVATALMSAALAYAAENGVRLVLLEVRRSNEGARSLYRRLGFEESAVRRAYYADNGEDAIEMMLTLKT